MKSQRQQYFLISYFKTLSYGSTGLWTRDLPNESPMLNRCSDAQPMLQQSPDIKSFLSGFIRLNSRYAKRTCVYCLFWCICFCNKKSMFCVDLFCRKNSGLCRKHARTKEYSIDLAENTSLQNPTTLTHVNPSCDFTCDWSKLNAWPTPWQHGLSTRASLVAISHVICRNWPERLSSASRITYWLAIAYRQVNKPCFPS